MGKPFEFVAEAKQVMKQGKPTAEVGVWTDGFGAFSDNEPLCAYRLKKGKKYKVTIEEVTN